MASSGRYREKVEFVRVSKTVPARTGKRSNQCEYRKMVSSESLPGNGRIRASVEKLSRRFPEKGRICVCTEKWHHRDPFREKVEPVRVSKNYPGEYRKRVESV